MNRPPISSLTFEEFLQWHPPVMGGSETGTPTGEPVQQQPVEQQGSTGDEFVDDFLKNVKPEHRPHVEPYFKDWGSKVTQRLQQVHSQYEPFKALVKGNVTPEYIQQAIDFAQEFDENPKRIYDFLLAEFGEQGQAPQPQQVPPPGQGTLNVPQEYEGLPQPFVDKFSKVEQLVTALAEHIMSNQQAQSQKTKQEAEDQAIRELLDGVAEKNDWLKSAPPQNRVNLERYILAEMAANGMNVDSAVNSVKQLIGQAGTGTPNGAPTASVGSVLKQPSNLTNGTPPVGQEPIDPRKLSRSATKDLVANILSNANRES